MEPENIFDRQSLQAWLEARPEAARQRDAVWIAYRSAARIFPLCGQRMRGNDTVPEAFSPLPSLRCLLIAGLARENLNDRLIVAAVSATNCGYHSVNHGETYSAFRGYEAASAVAQAGAIGEASLLDSAAISAILAASDAAGAAAGVGAPNSFSIQDAADSASYVADLDQDFWDAIRRDARALFAGQRDIPLWGVVPDWFDVACKEARRRRSVDAPATWDFWQRWWDGVVSGQPLPWDLQEKVALIEDAIWQQGAKEVAEEIARIEAELDPIPTVTVEALLTSQDAGGWRLVPGAAMLQLYVHEAPVAPKEEQLAKMLADRARKLLSALGSRANQQTVRGLVGREAEDLLRLLEDRDRNLSLRALEIWGSVVALASYLEENDFARRHGRDPLDLLTAEGKAALLTLVTIGGNLVRAFPETRDLDDSALAFARQSVERETLIAMIETALSSKLVDGMSAALMSHVASITAAQGQQAQKARVVSVKGLMNLTSMALVFAVGALSGGVIGKVGEDLVDHYKISRHAFDYLERIRNSPELLDQFLDSLPVSERSRLRIEIEAAWAKMNRVGPF